MNITFGLEVEIKNTSSKEITTPLGAAVDRRIELLKLADEENKIMG